jgi:hypothetical protein
VQLEAEERTNHSNSIIKLYSNGILKLQAYLNNSKEVSREFAEITFLVQCTNCDYAELLERLRPITIPFTILFTPSIELKKNLEEIRKNNSSYALLIDDNIDDEKYELETDANKSKLSRNVVNLIADFGRDNNYILDDNSEIYNSIVFPFIRDELTERKISMSNLNDYIDLRGKPAGQIQSIFKFHCENGRGKQRRVLVLRVDEFLLLQPDIIKFGRLGDKFFPL